MTASESAAHAVDVSISDAVVADAGEVLTLQRAAFLADAQMYDDPFMASLTQPLDEIEALIARSDVVFLVARVGHRIVGSVRAEVAGRLARIGRLMTAPDMQGRGIGSRLMDDLEQRVDGTVATLQLHTGDRSEATIAFYRRRGYDLIDDLDAPPGAVTMTKPARPGD